jgi:hypothetical protein
MNTTTTSPRYDLALILTLTAIAAAVTVLLRLYPVAYNFTPVGALCLFLGARLRAWWGLFIPLLLMLGTDFLIWQTKPDMPVWHYQTPYVYGSFALMFVLGFVWLRNRDNPVAILGAAVAGGLPFFLITNFSSWYSVAIAHTVQPMGDLDNYAPNLFGLLECYWKAIPWHNAMLCGDLLFSTCLFGSYALASSALTYGEAAQDVPISR